MTDIDWRQKAACRDHDPDIWFPNPGDLRTRETAIRICRGCPVRLNCAIYADQTRTPYGIWGGLRRNQFGRIDAHQQRAVR